MTVAADSPVAWLITGAGGQLGHDLMLALDGENVTALTRSDCDITDADAVASAFREWVRRWSGRHLVVLNAAAWTDVDGAEEAEDAALAANATAVGVLAAECDVAGVRLIHISTDYVFAGNASVPYPVDAPIAPRSAYGRTKAAGERAVLETLPDSSYIVRTAWVYGASGKNFVKTMAKLEAERETLMVVDDQQGSPTWSRDLAHGLVALGRGDAPAGIYHCTNGGDTTWCGLARAVFAELGADPERVRPTTTGAFPRPAPRPAYSVLSNATWRGAGLPELPHWRTALARAFATVGDALRP